MRFAREILRSVLSGAGLLFVPLLIVTATWFLYAGTLMLSTGFVDAMSALWKEALGLKVVWAVVAMRGQRRIRVGCQD